MWQILKYFARSFSQAQTTYTSMDNLFIFLCHRVDHQEGNDGSHNDLRSPPSPPFMQKCSKDEKKCKI